MAFAIHGNPAGLDAAPPSPATDPRAAQESSPIRTLTGGTPPGQLGQGGSGGPGGPGGVPGGAPGQPGQPPPTGPDNSGLMMLGQKLSESMLILAQGMPEVAGQIDQARALLENALANWSQQTMGGPSMGGAPPGVQSPPMGATSQAGPQYPGGGFGAGKPF